MRARRLLRPLGRGLRRLQARRAERLQRSTGDAVVLVYHRVAEPEFDPWRLAVSPAHFAEHLSLITDQFRPLSLEELANGLGARSLPRRCVTVTFDDGYRDNLDAAKPLLEEYGVPATVFVVTAYVGSDRDFWWDELEELLRRTTLPQLEDRRAVWRRLRELSHAERLGELDAWWQRSGFEPPSARSVPSAEEIVALAEGDLVEVGAHTVTHPRLPALQCAGQLDEIGSSKERLEQLLDRQVTSFSYPYGEYNRTTVRCVREAGLQRACASGERALTSKAPVFELPRLQATDVSGEELEQILELRLR